MKLTQPQLLRETRALGPATGAHVPARWVQPGHQSVPNAFARRAVSQVCLASPPAHACTSQMLLPSLHI